MFVCFCTYPGAAQGCQANGVAYEAGWQRNLDTTPYRITWDLFLHTDLYHLAQCLLLIAVFDVLFAYHTKARWFVLHLIANGFVVAAAFPDVVSTIRDPANAILTSNYSIWPTYFVCPYCF